MGANLDPTTNGDARQIQRAVRNEWIQPDGIQRFETRTSQRELIERIRKAPQEASIMDLATLAVIRGLQDGNGREASIAARTAVAMERANQRDDEMRAMLEMRTQADGTSDVKSLDWDSMYEPQSNEAARALQELESTND